MQISSAAFRHYYVVDMSTFSTLDEFITSLKVQHVHMQINLCKKGVDETESTNNESDTFKG